MTSACVSPWLWGHNWVVVGGRGTSAHACYAASVGGSGVQNAIYVGFLRERESSKDGGRR
jgi:hypothetical protein